VPTETVYGLAADARNPDAVMKIFAAKDRPRSHPLIVHVHNAECLSQWASDIPDAAYALAVAFWPGPLTLLLKKAPGVNCTVTGGLDTIGLRVPDHAVLRNVIEALGSGLAAPSANPHKKLSPTSAQQVMACLDGKIAAVLDGGNCTVGLESTIVDLTTDEIRILRSGPITRGQLEAVLGQPVILPQQHTMAVPGNMQVHYQPHTPLHILTHQALITALQHCDSSRCAVLAFGTPSSELRQIPVHTCIAMPQDKQAYASVLYQRLYELDQLQPACILLEQPPQTEAWLDVNDRLGKAASPLAN